MFKIYWIWWSIIIWTQLHFWSLLYINRVCLLGNRTLRNSKFDKCLKTELINNVTTPTQLWKIFCEGGIENATCDEYFTHNNLTEIQAVPGLLSGVISGECSNIITHQAI